MQNLIKNEIIKLNSRKKYLICIIIFALLCGVFSFAYSKIQKLATPDAQISLYTKEKTQLENQKNSTSDTTKQQQLEQGIQQLDSEIQQLKLNKKASSGNWKTNVKNTIDTLRDEKNSATDMSAASAKETYNKQIILLQYLLNHNIKPQNNGDFSAFNFLTSLFKLIGPLFIPIVLAILSADIVSGEYTPPTMKMLLTRPAKRGKILLSKFISIVISSIIIIIVIELLFYLIMGIIYGFDNPAYPVVVGTKYTSGLVNVTQDGSSLIPVLGSSYIMSTWKFIIEMFLFQIIYIVTCCSFFILLSTVLKSSSLSMTLSILLTIVINILSSISYLAKISPFFFTTYGSISTTLDSSLPLSTNVKFSTPLFAVIFMIIFSAVCYAISYFTFEKKDINI